MITGFTPVPPGQHIALLATLGTGTCMCHLWSSSSLLYKERTVHQRYDDRCAPLFSPVFPLDPSILMANRSGDFGRFRGETRNQSKAEMSGIPPPRSRSLTNRGSILYLVSIVARTDSNTNTNRDAQAALLCYAPRKPHPDPLRVAERVPEGRERPFRMRA